jgi:hypothetical protein
MDSAKYRFFSMTEEVVKLMVDALVVVHWNERVGEFNKDFVAFPNGKRPEFFYARGGGSTPLHVRVMVGEDQWQTFVCHNPSEREGDVNICVLE